MSNSPTKKINMRVAVTKRMLKEGLLRCLETKDLEEITISELCKEAGINRATFYKHYNSPFDLLNDIGLDHSEQIFELYNKTLSENPGNEEAAQLKCYEYLFNHKKDLQVLFSANADKYFAEFAMKYFREAWSNNPQFQKNYDLDPVEAKLAVTAFSWSTYCIVRQWILEDLPKSPKEIVDLLKKVQPLNFIYKV